MDTTALRALCDQGLWRVQQAQAHRCPYRATKAAYQASMAQIMDADVGPIVDVLQQIQAGLDEEPSDPDQPESPVEGPKAEDWANLLSGASGLTGQQKWLPGSTGIDLFCERWTVVRAPFAGRLTWRNGDLTLVNANGACVRFRHVSPLLTSGDVDVGLPVARVFDASLDVLRWPVGYPMPPDGYQHLDVSLARSPSGLNPQGGAGGDIPAYDYIWNQQGGLPNFEVIGRTPGPPEGSR